MKMEDGSGKRDANDRIGCFRDAFGRVTMGLPKYARAVIDDEENPAGRTPSGDPLPPVSQRIPRPAFSIHDLSLYEMIFVFGGLLGAVFNCFGSIVGFAIWLPVNIGLAILNHKRGSKWQSALFAAYTLTAVWGILRVKG